MSVVVVLVLILGLGAALWLSWRHRQWVRAQRQAFAAAKGLTAVDRDDSWAQRWSCHPFDLGFDRRASNVLVGPWRGRRVAAFDHSYVTTSTDAQGRTSRTTHRHAVCVLALPGWLGEVSVDRENVLTRLGSHLGLTDIELESEDFNRRFRVVSADRKLASDVLNPRTMQALLDLPDCAPWRVVGGDLVTVEDGRTSLEWIEARWEQLALVADGVPDFVWRDRGVDPAAR